MKSLAIPKLPESDVTSISVFNTTADQSIAMKSVNVLDESLDIGLICEQAEMLRDEFGFDELVEADRGEQRTSSGVVDTSGEFRDKLKTMKRYLPSRNNKNRDRNIFPTTPIKQSDVFSGPKETSHVTIRKFMTASTPLVNTQKPNESPFGNVSNIEEAEETEKEAENDSMQVEDESKIELFADQSEVCVKDVRKINKFHNLKFNFIFFRHNEVTLDARESQISLDTLNIPKVIQMKT